MKKIKHISAKTKILVFTLLLIILPSSYLGYLGFKSIEDRSLRLKDNYQGLVKLLRDKLEGDLLNLEGTFIREIITRNWDEEFQVIKFELDQAQSQYPFIHDIFIIDVEGTVIHPKMVLKARGSIPLEQGITQSIRNELIDSGEQYEFVERDYQTAIRSYMKAMEQASSYRLRSYAHILVARCYFKMKDYRTAQKEYRKIVEKSENAYSPDGTPLKIIGLSQLSETYTLLGQDRDKHQSLLELYEELISTPWGFDSFDFYLQTVKAELNQISRAKNWEKNDLARLDNLRDKERKKTERGRYLQLAQRALLPQLNSNPVMNNIAEAPSLRIPAHQTIKDSDGMSYQIGYIPLLSSRDQTTQRFLVYRFNKEFVLTNLLSDIENKGDLGDNLQVGIFSEEESLDFPSEASSPPRALASENLSQFFPWWRLLLFDKKGKTVELMVRNEKRLYGAALFGIFSIILVGVIMTLKAATHEAEVGRLKSEFISNVSHEMKTPLALIRLFGETLELDQVEDPIQRKKFSRIIAQESERLSHLIENVLDFSKIDSGRREYNFEEADLVKVVSTTLEAFKFHLKDQGFEFAVSLSKSPILMQMDKDAISQAVLNLLDNAEKYSKKRKYIGIEITSKNNEAWIMVEDRGSGIPESSLKHLFDKFYRGKHASAREVQGSGLGLTIVKHIVESHGGQIDVKSEVEKGSRFIIKLPITRRKKAIEQV